MADNFIIDDEALKKGEKLFRQECTFAAGADSSARLPEETLPEVAFAGRSNVGKSSLVNALTGRRTLARASNTPGRTQQINFFNLGDEMFLVDLPGYGYAAAARDKRDDWNKMVQDYLETRKTLRAVCVLIDARHGLKNSDIGAMHVLDKADVPFIAVLTKADKVKPTELAALLPRIEQELDRFETVFPKAFATSSETKQGIPELRATLSWMGLSP